MNKYYAFLACLLISFGIWVVYNLSQTFSEVVSMDVVARSNIEAHSQISSAPVTVYARCRATGFRLARLDRTNRKPVSVYISPEFFSSRDENNYVISSKDLARYTTGIFGERVSLESFNESEYSFRFSVEDCIKVPVVPVQTISYRQQYKPAGSIRFEPDSVLVYGDPGLISGIERVVTRQISLNDVHGNVFGRTKLEKIRGLRYSAYEVDYSLNVQRYVELKYECPVQLRNVPPGHKFSVYPSSVTVVFNCAFPLQEDPRDRISFHVDYNDFAASISGKCLIHMEGVCNGLIDCTVEPQTCDCFEILN